MFDDFLLQYIRRGNFIEIVEAVVLQPKDVQAGFIAGHQFVVAKELEAFVGNALVAIF
jgi:hypothetical protein